MATTTNYSWTTPDDTALVKDGAAAIRTLGSSADTTVKALNPGTTAGDIDYYTAATTKARIAIGTAGQVLQVNSGATAPEWATPSSGGMTLLSTTTLASTSTTVSGISGAYNDIVFIVQGAVWGTSDQSITVRPNGSATLLWAAGLTNETGNPANPVTLTDSFFTTGTITRTGGSNAVYFIINNYANTSYYKTFEAIGGGLKSGGTMLTIHSGIVKTSSAITSVTIQTSSSATFSGGQILVYGVK